MTQVEIEKKWLLLEGAYTASAFKLYDKKCRRNHINFILNTLNLGISSDRDLGSFDELAHTIGLYDHVLQNGNQIEQGYLPDLSILKHLQIDDNTIGFTATSIRLRKYKNLHFLTLKGKNENYEIGNNEFEVTIEEKIFNNHWHRTQGKRVSKKRLEVEWNGFTYEIDAFIDRILLIVECEVKDENQLKELSDIGWDITTNDSYSNKNLAK
jgi:CYTH domain-containing protein